MKKKKHKVSLTLAHALICRLYADAVEENKQLKRELNEVLLECEELREECAWRKKWCDNLDNIRGEKE